jgi:hypothetical protein
MTRLLPLVVLLAFGFSAAPSPTARLVVLNKEDATLVTVDPATSSSCQALCPLPFARHARPR